MKARVIVHIGLPKTATTALQKHVFAPLDQHGLAYWGVRQPRHKKQPAWYYRLTKATQSIAEPTLDELNYLQMAIREQGSSQPILISEEMFCVDSAIPWQDKLARLGKILAPFDSRILVTIRNPVDAMFSLYAELWTGIRKSYPTFDEFAATSNQAKLFQYDYLLEVLESHFDQKNLEFVEFEAIRSGRQFLQKIERALGLETPLDRLPRENRRKKSSQFVTTSNLTLRQLIGYSPRPVMPEASLLVKIWRRTANRLLNFSVPLTARQIPKPNRQSFQDGFITSSQCLLDRFGIDYISSCNNEHD